MSKQSLPSNAPARASAKPPWLGLFVLLLAGFVTLFDLFVVNVAIPNMQLKLRASFAQIGFIVVGYELGFGVLLITGGRLGDLYGRRRLFIAGMAGFTVTSALCGLAPNVDFLIGARALQGAAAAMLFPQVYASIRVNFDGDDARRAFGLLGMTLGMAAIAGQVLGGWLIYANLFELGWRNIFLINVPIGIVAILMARYIPESRSPQRPTLDWCGVLLLSVALTCLLVPLIEGPSQHWPIWSLCILGVAIVLLASFYLQQEKRRREGQQPLVDMQLLRQGRFALGAILVLLVYSTSSSFFLCFALLAQTGLGLDPLTAGTIFAPCSAGFVLASLVMPRLVARWGTSVIVIGAIFYAAAIGILIAQVKTAGAGLILERLIPVLILLGAGQGSIMTPLLNLVLGFVEEIQAGMASGVISTAQQIGAALGLAVVGMLFSAALTAGHSEMTPAGLYTRAFAAGMFYNLIASALVCVLLALLAKDQRH